jgi:hypothetical protein
MDGPEIASAEMIGLPDALAAPGASVVVPAPGRGVGYWAGAPSAIVSGGAVWLAYRLRRPVHLGRGYANVVARSIDGLTFEIVATVTSAQLGCASLERPALVRRPDGGWRMYVSCAESGSKHWWVEAINADSPDRLAEGKRTVVLAGSEVEAWKDVVVRPEPGGWRMWACRHPLDAGADAADRMTTWYATSEDGLAWTMVAAALRPQPSTWAARGTRITEVLHVAGRWWALYDGRRTAAETFCERTGLAVGDRPDRLVPLAGPVPAKPGAALRYVSVIAVPEGWRAYFEAAAADGSHELRAVVVRTRRGQAMTSKSIVPGL